MENQIGKKKTMKSRNLNVLQFLFGCLLFLSVGISCIKPVATGLIKDAYIGSAFSFRINDAIALACPNMELDKAVELQQLVEGHSRLDSVIHRYLRAYASWLTGDKTSPIRIDNSRAFNKMNQNILKETKKRTPDTGLTISDEEFTTYLIQAEEETEHILQTQVPQNLQNFGKTAVTAIKAYRLLTSFWIQALLLLAMLLLFLYPMIIRTLAASAGAAPVSGFYRSIGTTFLLQGLFWAAAPAACMKLADRWLLFLVNRLLGRSMHLNASPFVQRGIIMIAAGIVLILLSSKLPLPVNRSSHGGHSEKLP